ncbi:ricin B-like lectin [Aspergillus ruber CBS 135680]|uniref:Ricin B-like lectin n=1 Tax=Aspergillus ruber (strain CBS 135680) TaxID=1388766 RepID=A0A017S684_ASPRC|nr:ricin B-like lectin [Aspergillus ruber CBS 135680]EYE91665.1 ricin B-like lectin [Aspergillus ruber CBS 135680]
MASQIRPGLYLLEVEHSHLLLDLDDSKTANGTAVQTYESKFDNVNQKWQVVSAGNDEYLILANKAGTYVTAPKQDTYEITGNLISPTDKHARWKFVEVGNGAYYIYSVAFPKSVFDVQRSGKNNKTSVLAYPARSSDNANQQWRLKPTQ